MEILKASELDSDGTSHVWGLEVLPASEYNTVFVRFIRKPNLILYLQFKHLQSEIKNVCVQYTTML